MDRTGRLKFLSAFLIDPAGAELYRLVNPTDKASIYCPDLSIRFLHKGAAECRSAIWPKPSADGI